MREDTKPYEPFRIIEFRERIGYGNLHSVIHLDIPLCELSYQVFAWKRNMPVICGEKNFDFSDKTIHMNFSRPAKVIKNEKNQLQTEVD